MTDEAGRQGRRTYPYMPDSNWWALRRRFQQTPPRGDVDAEYLSGVLNITVPAAQNLLPALRAVGLIDDANRPTDLVGEWRDDETYRAATTRMIDAVYPQGLRDVAPPPDPDRGAVERWFARATGSGRAACQRMARFYLLLAAGDVAAAGGQATAERTRARGETTPRATTGPRRRTTQAATAPTASAAAQPASPTTPRQQAPTVHIDIQVHIDPASTAEQIDQIFASMARHLYRHD